MGKALAMVPLPDSASAADRSFCRTPIKLCLLFEQSVDEAII
jgi:hypothetical protein